MQTLPGDPTVEIEPAATISEDGFSVQRLACGSHTGTHIDAPSHMIPDGDPLGDRPIEAFAFDAQFVDVTPCEPRGSIGPDRLPDVPENVDLLVVRTGWETHFDTDRYLEYPFLTEAAGTRLRDAACGIATDTISPDPMAEAGATGFPVHHELLGAGLPIVENLRNLDGLPEQFRLYAFPLPIDSDGAPVRAVAELSHSR